MHANAATRPACSAGQASASAWPLIRGDIVITLSPDGNCPAEAIPQLTAAMCAGDDMVIASRYLDGLKSEDERTLKVLRWGGSYFLQVFRELYYWS